MPTVTVRELARKTAAVIQEVEASGRPALVTRNGRPVAALIALDERALEDWLLASAADANAGVAERGLSATGEQSGEWQRSERASPTRPRPAQASPPAHLRGSHRGA